MRQWILLSVVLVGASYEGWTLFQRHREDIWITAYSQGCTAFTAGKYADAEQILAAALPQTEQWWPHGSELVDNLRVLAMSYRAEHKYDQAKPLFERALELSTNVSSADDPMSLGRIKMGLAVIARDEGDDEKADKLFSEAFTIFEKNPDAALGDDASTMLNLGYLRGEQGRYAEAETMLTRAIARFEVLSKPSLRRDLANAHFQLADTYRRESRYADAAKQYQTSLVAETFIPFFNPQASLSSPLTVIFWPSGMVNF